MAELPDRPFKPLKTTPAYPLVKEERESIKRLQREDERRALLDERRNHEPTADTRRRLRDRIWPWSEIRRRQDDARFFADLASRIEEQDRNRVARGTVRALEAGLKRAEAERDELLDALQPFAEWYEEADPLIGSSSAVFTHTVEFKRAHELVERDG